MRNCINCINCSNATNCGSRRDGRRLPFHDIRLGGCPPDRGAVCRAGQAGRGGGGFDEAGLRTHDGEHPDVVIQLIVERQIDARQAGAVNGRPH